MICNQSRMTDFANDTTKCFLEFYPDATLDEVERGLREAIRDAAEIFADCQPDPNARREDRALRVRHMALS